MEEVQENHDKINSNIQLEQLIFQQKREKISLLNKISQLEKQQKILNSEVEQYRREIDDQKMKIKQFTNLIVKQELVQNKMNILIQTLVQKDNQQQQRTINHEHSLSVPQTGMKQNKLYSNQELKTKKSEQQSLDEKLVKEKGDYGYQDSKQKFPSIVGEQNKMVVVQVHRSKLKKMTSQQVKELLNKE